MTGPSQSPQRIARPPWIAAAAAAAVGVLVAVSLVIYLGLVARGGTWPVYVFAVAAAPLALLAVGQALHVLAPPVLRAMTMAVRPFVRAIWPAREEGPGEQT